MVNVRFVSKRKNQHQNYLLNEIKHVLKGYPKNHILELHELKAMYLNETEFLAQALKELIEENEYLYKNATYIRL